MLQVNVKLVDNQFLVYLGNFLVLRPVVHRALRKLPATPFPRTVHRAHTELRTVSIGFLGGGASEPAVQYSAAADDNCTSNHGPSIRSVRWIVVTLCRYLPTFSPEPTVSPLRPLASCLIGTRTQRPKSSVPFLVPIVLRARLVMFRSRFAAPTCSPLRLAPVEPTGVQICRYMPVVSRVTPATSFRSDILRVSPCFFYFVIIVNAAARVFMFFVSVE